MPSISTPTSSVELRELRFFFVGACVIALVICLGFARNIAVGNSSFSLPPLFHLHAVTFFAWTFLFVVQSGLVLARHGHLHRQLGMFALPLMLAMAGFGVPLLIFSLRRGMLPPFYDLREFLFGVLAQLIGFLALALTGLALRRRTDAHRRLLFCAAALLAKAGFDRLLPVPLFGSLAWWLPALAVYLFPLCGMVFDWWNRKRIHQAWFLACAIMATAHLGAAFLSHTQIATEIVRQLTEGTPGASRPVTAFAPAG